MFADDTKLYRDIANQSDIEIIQNDINNLFKWSEKWLLRFHPDKCKVLSIIGKRHQQRTTKYTMLSGNIFVALRWTFSIASMSLVLYGFQTLLAYSRIGLTSDLNSKQNVLKSKYLNDLLIVPVKSCQSLVNAINKEPQNTRCQHTRDHTSP
jgi:hypothetical protein